MGHVETRVEPHRTQKQACRSYKDILVHSKYSIHGNIVSMHAFEISEESWQIASGAQILRLKLVFTFHFFISHLPSIFPPPFYPPSVKCCQFLETKGSEFYPTVTDVRNE